MPVTASQAPTGPTAWASAEDRVREVGEPLAVRVDDQRHHGERRQHQAQRVEQRRPRRGRRPARPRAPVQAVRTLTAPVTSSRSAVRGLRASMSPVDDPVGRHRERPGADHRDRDQQQRRPSGRAVALEHRGQRGDVGERQREDRVLDHHQPQERLDRVRRDVPARASGRRSRHVRSQARTPSSAGRPAADRPPGRHDALVRPARARVALGRAASGWRRCPPCRPRTAGTRRGPGGRPGPAVSSRSWA